MARTLHRSTGFSFLALILIAGVSLWLSDQRPTLSADGGENGIVFGDLEADPVTSANEISFYWEASTTDGVELRPTFVIQEGNSAPKLAEVASYSSEEQNPMPMIEAGSYYSWTMVVGLRPCLEHRLWLAHLPKELMDAVMTDFTEDLWARMTARSNPLRFWTRSADGGGCDLNPSRKTTSALIEGLAKTSNPKQRQVAVRWRNPGGIEPVVMVKRLGTEEGTERLASLKRAQNPLAPGATEATINRLEPCTRYRVRVYERHPAFGSAEQPLRVFRGNQDRKTNGIVIQTSGCDR